MKKAQPWTRTNDLVLVLLSGPFLVEVEEKREQNRTLVVTIKFPSKVKITSELPVT
jgi:hypothetical protein